MIPQSSPITLQVCLISQTSTGLIFTELATANRVLIPYISKSTYPVRSPGLIRLLQNILLIAIHKVFIRKFTNRDRQEITILSSLIALAIIINLDLLLSPVWGFDGAVLVSSWGYFLTAVCLIVFVEHDAGIAISSIIINRWSDFTGISERTKLILHSEEATKGR
jgi:hypothetical protein